MAWALGGGVHLTEKPWVRSALGHPDGVLVATRGQRYAYGADVQILPGCLAAATTAKPKVTCVQRTSTQSLSGGSLSVKEFT
ncbi:hypothetical protein HRbin30_01456 [bacterium HR30]|nr:hypothetical protein HRbin30_01456 [bacterium HR30]